MQNVQSNAIYLDYIIRQPFHLCAIRMILPINISRFTGFQIDDLRSNSKIYSSSAISQVSIHFVFAIR